MSDRVQAATRSLRNDENAVRIDLARDNRPGMSRPEANQADAQLHAAVEKLRLDATKVSPADALEVLKALQVAERDPLVKLEDGHLVFDNVRFQEEKLQQKGTRMLNGVEHLEKKGQDALEGLGRLFRW